MFEIIAELDRKRGCLSIPVEIADELLRRGVYFIEQDVDMKTGRVTVELFDKSKTPIDGDGFSLKIIRKREAHGATD